MNCECCVKGKMARLPSPKESKNKTNSTLDLIHFGRVRYESQKRNNKMYKRICRNDENTVSKKANKKIIKSDRETEHVNEDFKKYLKQKRIQAQYMATYSPQPSGDADKILAERMNRSLLEMARCTLVI